MNVSVVTTSSSAMGMSAMKDSFTPGSGLTSAARFWLRGILMWKLIGRLISSTSDQKGSYAGSHSGLPPRSSGKGSTWNPFRPSFATRSSSAIPSFRSRRGMCARPTRRPGAARESSTIQSLYVRTTNMRSSASFAYCVTGPPK